MLPAWAAAPIPVIAPEPTTPLPTPSASKAMTVRQYQVTHNGTTDRSRVPRQRHA